MKPRKPKQTAKTSLFAKLDRGGGCTLTPQEADALREEFSRFLQRVSELANVNMAMAAALKRHNLQVTHEKHDDGSVSFDLIPLVPDTEPYTEPVMN